jgi:hypothetical protein
LLAPVTFFEAQIRDALPMPPCRSTPLVFAAMPPPPPAIIAADMRRHARDAAAPPPCRDAHGMLPPSRQPTPLILLRPPPSPPYSDAMPRHVALRLSRQPREDYASFVSFAAAAPLTRRRYYDAARH